MIGTAFRWLGRNAVLYVAIIVAILVYGVWSSGDIQAAWNESQTINLRRANALETVVADATAHRTELELELKRAGERAQQEATAELEQQISVAKAERDRLNADQPSRLETMLDAATLDIAAIRKEHERALMIAFLDRKIRGLEKAAETARNYDAAMRKARASARNIDKKLGTASSVLEQRQEAYRVARQSCRSAKAAVSSFDASWTRTTLDRLPFQQRRKDLVRAEAKLCAEQDRTANALRSAKGAVSRLRQLQANGSQQITRAQDWIRTELPDTVEVLRRQVTEERANAQETTTARVTWAWAHYNVSGVLKVAAIALALIIATPFLIRLFCYFVLAPLAMRRPSIRLRVPKGRGVAVPQAAPSATSVAVRLEPGEELLVRQDYFQTSSQNGPKRTQWWLDWRKPITSFATGLTFLKRIRGDGETTTVSAVQDGFAEVTILTLPEGAACVLQPRALAAVAQPIRRRLRITRHWRLGSLNAWLTLQLRYLVFHGPARLVLKGGRGVRVEPAEQGRVFGQDQLVGFSADLAYSVTRTDTFWPYFLGREQLLKDRVMAGNGVLIVEESPLSARRGETRRGLEGMIDAGMKVFGM